MINMSRIKSAASARSNAIGASLRSGRSNRAQGASTKPGKTLEYPCHPCMRENENVEATNFCEDCEENLCAKCIKDHSKFQSMQTHTILGKTSRRSVSHVGAVPKVNPLECSQHPGKLVDMFCAEHDQIWCGACMAINHKECQNILEIQEAAKGISKKSVFKEIKEESRKLKKELMSSKKLRMRDITRFDKQKNLVMKRVKEHRMKIDKLLDNLEKETMAELERACDKASNELKEGVKRFETIITGLTAATDMLTIVKGEAVNEKAIFVGLKRAKQNILEGERLLHYATHAHNVAPIVYYPDENIINWLNSFRFLGTFTHQQTIYSGKLVDRYDVSMADEFKTCDMFGSAILPEGRLILTDWDNKKVKLLDSSFEVVDHVVVLSNPNDVCITNPAEAIVSLPMQKTIQFIKLEPIMELSRKILTEEHCRGLCYNNGNIYVACGGFKDEGPGRIVVYSVTGDHVRTIEKNRTGQQIFVCPIAVTVLSDGKLLYITDGRRGIITLTSEDEVVSVLTHKDIAWPCGICLENNGQVLVCNGQKNSVIQLTGFDKFATILSKKDKLNRPHSISFDSKTSRVVLTMNRSNFVYVYQLQDISVTQALEGAKLTLDTAKTHKPNVNKTNETKKEDNDSNNLKHAKELTANVSDTTVETDQSISKNDTETTKMDATLMPTPTELKRIPEESNSGKKASLRRRSSLSSIPSDKKSVLSNPGGGSNRIRTGSTDRSRVKTSSRESNMSGETGRMSVNSARRDRKSSSMSDRISNQLREIKALNPTET